VPKGYLAPIVLGDSSASATVTLKSLPEVAAGKKLHCEVIHPGDTEWKDCEYRAKGRTLRSKCRFAAAAR